MPRAPAERLRQSYCHRGGASPLLGATIPEHLAQVAAAHADREAVVGLPQGRRLDYRSLREAVDRLAAGLIGLGFGRGDRIGLWSPNNVEWLLVQLATARVGVVLVNLNPGHGGEELRQALRHAAVRGLIAAPEHRGGDNLAILRDLVPDLDRLEPGRWRAPSLPELRTLVLLDRANPDRAGRALRGAHTWGEALDAAERVGAARLEAASAALDRDDPVNIQFTSGTTGSPKAVVLSHHNLLNNAYFTAREMGITAGDRLCVPVPFYHCFGMVLANLMCLSVGACVVIPCAHFDALAVLGAIDAERCTAVHGVPTMFVAELDHPRFGEFDLSSLRTGIMAGAPCPPALLRRVMREMRCTGILVGYGQTEASPLTHLTGARDGLRRRTETVGRNLPHQEVKVVDTGTGRTLPVGSVGEICFRGYHLMRGYYGDARATAAAIDERGWLHSGDLGAMDQSGYLRVTGRPKDLIIRGGENIYPAEIEACILAHPGVAQAAVFGLPDHYYGEIVCAWVQLRAGSRAEEHDLREHCRRHLARFKIPARIRVVDAFPMTVTGKPQKFRMRDAEVEAGKAG